MPRAGRGGGLRPDEHLEVAGNLFLAAEAVHARARGAELADLDAAVGALGAAEEERGAVHITAHAVGAWWNRGTGRPADQLRSVVPQHLVARDRPLEAAVNQDRKSAC